MEKLIPVESGLNAYRFGFDPKLLDKIRSVYVSAISKVLDTRENAAVLEGGVSRNFRLGNDAYKFFGMSYGNAPLFWVSANDAVTHRLFTDFFDALGIKGDIKSLVDCDKDVVMYSGFFVVSNRFHEPAWHVDYFENANAYTLLAPLFPLNRGHGQLLYKDNDGAVKKYSYRYDEAIIVGEGFEHTTEVYPANSATRVLVSLTFGSDRLQYWDMLERTVGQQTEFLILPCGHQRGTCTCVAAPPDTVGLP